MADCDLSDSDWVNKHSGGPDEELREAADKMWAADPTKMIDMLVASQTKPLPTVASGYGYRTEALRAASRMTAPIATNEHMAIWNAGDVLEVAEQFARWLETGER